jgi:hypothetical protein
MTPTLLILVRKATELLRPALPVGTRRLVAELQALIPDDLAEARCAESSRVAWGELPDPKEFGRAALTAEALEALGCETRGQGAKQEAWLDRAEEPEADPPAEETAPQPPPAVEQPLQAAGETAPADTTVAAQAARPAGPPELQLVWLPVRDLRLHPVAERIPRMRPEEWRAFLQDAKGQGVQDPIRVQKGGLVLNGRHRLEAARERGDETIPAIVVELTEQEQVDCIYRSTILCRHLRDDQRAVLAQDWAAVEAARSKQERARKGGNAGGRSRRKDTLEESVKAEPNSSASPGGAEQSPEAQAPPEPRTPRARERAAEAFNVSNKKVAKAAALAATDPELADEVRAGEKTLAEAHKELRAQAEEKRPAATERPKHSPDRKLAATLTRFANEARLTMPWPPDPSVLAQVLYHQLGPKKSTQLHAVLGELIRTKGQNPGTRRVEFGSPQYFWQDVPADADPEGPPRDGQAIEREGRSLGDHPGPAAPGSGEAGEVTAAS